MKGKENYEQENGKQFCKICKSSKFVTVIFCFYQITALKKLWKMLFISTRKLFSFSRYSIFCISLFPLFSSCLSLLEKMINDKSYNLWHHQFAKQEFKNTYFDTLKRKVGLISKLGQLMKYQTRNIFMEKVSRK